MRSKVSPEIDQQGRNQRVRSVERRIDYEVSKIRDLRDFQRNGQERIEDELKNCDKFYSDLEYWFIYRNPGMDPLGVESMATELFVEICERKKQELKPKIELDPIDRNIFAIIGSAKKALQQSGENQKAEEMIDKTYSTHSYEEALQVVMEYVDFI